MIETKMIILDGKTRGIAIQYIKNDKDQFVVYCDRKTEEWKIRLYPNLQTATVAANLIVKNNSQKFFIMIDDKMIDLNKVQIEKSHLEVFDGDIRYIIFEDHTAKAYDFRYIVFNNGDEILSEKEEGLKNQRKIFDNIVNALYYDFLQIGSEITAIRQRDSECIVEVANSTAKIHIIFNKRLIEINKERKEKDMYCFHFLKNMDRYNTFYVFVTRDVKEPKIANSENKCNLILENLEKNLFEYCDDEMTKMIKLDNIYSINYVEE